MSTFPEIYFNTQSFVVTIPVSTFPEKERKKERENGRKTEKEREKMEERQTEKERKRKNGRKREKKRKREREFPRFHLNLCTMMLVNLFIFIL